MPVVSGLRRAMKISAHAWLAVAMANGRTNHEMPMLGRSGSQKESTCTKFVAQTPSPIAMELSRTAHARPRALTVETRTASARVVYDRRAAIAAASASPQASVVKTVIHRALPQGFANRARQ